MSVAYVLLKADESCYGADIVVGVFASLESAQAAARGRGEWAFDPETDEWSCGWFEIQRHEVAP